MLEKLPYLLAKSSGLTSLASTSNSPSTMDYGGEVSGGTEEQLKLLLLSSLSTSTLLVASTAY